MEQWKQIKYEGIIYNYEISSHGRVRNMKNGKIRKATDNGIGYLRVPLIKNKKRKDLLIHRLVANAFIPNPNNYSDVNHINENKHDNRVENLEWVSHKNNMSHGTCQQRKAETQSKRVRCIETGQEFDSIKHVKEETGLNVGDCCRGKYKTCGKLHWEFID